MDCAEAHAAISRDIDGELPTGERKRLWEHVGGCPDCKRFQERCRDLQTAINAAAVPECGRGRSNELRSRLSRQLEGRRPVVGLRFYRRFSYAAAAACALLAAALVLQHHSLKRASSAQGSEARLKQARHLFSLVESGELADKARAFGVVSDYFAGSLRWMVEDRDQAGLGVAQEARQAERRGHVRPVILGMRLLKGREGSAASLVSAPTLMLLPGGEANFSLAPTDGDAPRRFGYRCWATQTAEGWIRVAVELRVDEATAGSPLRLSGLLNLREGEVSPVGYATSADASYELFISAHCAGESPSKAEGA